MTIKKIAEKYHLDYQLVYQALDCSGDLVRGCKDTEYDELRTVWACAQYIDDRLNKLEEKANDLIDALKRINSVLKNEG